MRFQWIAGGIAGLALATIALWPVRPPPDTIPALSGATLPIPMQTEIVAAPSPPETAAAPTPPATSAPAAAPALPKLPSREVAMRTPHVVPENDPLPPTRPFEFKSAPGLAAQPTPRRETTTASIPRGAPSRAAQLAGAAQASGATALLVAGRPLVLFGVRPPMSGDRCLSPSGLNIGAAPSCVDKAHDALAARLARNATVFCRLPAPATAAGAAICLDAEGVDLGGLLVAEGLALADPSQSYDYVGAETVARSQGRGLWRFR
jgi:endonuclease YncB( thermonuclease family)